MIALLQLMKNNEEVSSVDLRLITYQIKLLYMEQQVQKKICQTILSYVQQHVQKKIYQAKLLYM